MFSRLSAFVCLFVLGTAVSAHATTLQFINDGTQLTGSINYTGGVVTSGDFTFKNGNTSYVFNSAPTLSVTNLADTILFTTFVNGAGDVFQLDFLLAAIAPNEYKVCSASSSCSYAFGALTAISYVDPAGLRNPPINVSAGALAATPEPSSFVLLGTGVVGVVGAARRRFLRA